jgi:hypothetical protein
LASGECKTRDPTLNVDTTVYNESATSAHATAAFSSERAYMDRIL